MHNMEGDDDDNGGKRKQQQQVIRHFVFDSQKTQEKFPWLGIAKQPSDQKVSSTANEICCYVRDSKCSKGCPTNGIICIPCVVSY